MDGRERGRFSCLQTSGVLKTNDLKVGYVKAKSTDNIYGHGHKYNLNSHLTLDSLLRKYRVVFRDMDAA